MTRALDVPVVPAHLPDALEYVYGRRGRRWLERSPDLLRQLAARWGLRLEWIYDTGQMSLCVAARDRQESPVVLKASPSPSLAGREIDALRSWNGHGAPRLLRSSKREGAFLMERIENDSGDAPSLQEALEVAQSLHGQSMLAPGRFPSLSRTVQQRLAWAHERFQHADTAAELRDATAAAEAVLHDRPVHSCLLHGDFQPKNLLGGKGRWAAIDPMPCVGDPAFDLALWAVSEPAPQLDAAVTHIADALRRDSGDVTRWIVRAAALELRLYLPERALALRSFIDRNRWALTDSATAGSAPAQ